MSKQVFTTFYNSVIRDITTFGGSPFFVAALLLTLLLKEYILTTKLILGLIFIMLIAVLIRSIYYKPRPKELPHRTWLEKVEASSFPSIHASRATFIALIFANFFQNTHVTILLIFAAIAVCYSRIFLRRHDIVDVVSGALFGTIIYGIISTELINTIISTIVYF